MTGEQILLLVMGFGLGAGAYAVLAEAARWDAARRLAYQLGRLAPKVPAPRLADHVVRGRHQYGPDMMPVRAETWAPQGAGDSRPLAVRINGTDLS